ncbi:MAG: hypothetical protein ISQ88_11615 [Rhodobacteraceae bacterium]|nr:hypothetical protein [Paracoccaceae bacterium]
MRIYRQFLLVSILCTGCTSVPSLLGFTEAKSTKDEYNPLIPKENIITKNNQRQYMGKLVNEVTDAELIITQAKDFILVVSGVTEHSIVYEPRLISVSTDRPNSLKFSFKALQATNKKSEPTKEKVITSAITISSKKLENIDKILIESTSGVFELKL